MEQHREIPDTPRPAKETKLAPQEEVVGDRPMASDKKSGATKEKSDASAAPQSDENEPKSDSPAEQVQVAARPKRLERLPPIETPSEQESPLSEHPLLMPTMPGVPSEILSDNPLESTRSIPDQSLGVKKAWPEPETLRERLEELAGIPKTAGWASRPLADLRRLGAAMEEGSPEAAEVLKRLSKAAASAPRTADGLQYELARKVRQAGYALQRRVDVWQSIVQLGATDFSEKECPGADSKKMALCLAHLDSLTRDSAEGPEWREYLLLDVLKELAEQREKSESISEDDPRPSPLRPLPDGQGAKDSRQRRREVAQQILERLIATPTTDPQRQFLNSPVMMDYREQIQRLAAEPVAPADVLSDLERYEQTRLGSDGQRLAFTLQVLALSSNPQRQIIAKQLDRNYRNANFRVALSEEFLNRLVPESKTEIAPVQETILNRPVRGQSMTSADVAIKLIPDPQRVRLSLEMTGEVAAMTSSTSGPATFLTDSESLVSGIKPVEIDRKGIRLLPSKVNVRHQTRLRYLETDFDGIPLFGWIVRGIAQKQHEQALQMADREARQKVAAKTQKRLDTEAYERLSVLVDRLNHNLFGPLDRLALDPTIIDAQTTEDRLTLRLRVAGDDQLGSHTPRPQAPTDCLASFQINETLLNNALARLQLEGKTFTLKELAQRIADRFQRPDVWKVPPANENVLVTFAPRDAVRVQCADGQVSLEMVIAEFKKPPRGWYNFRIRVFYRSQIEGRKVELVREGPIHLMAEGLSLRSQIALRGAFTKAFPEGQAVNVTPKRLLTDPQLGDLRITQLLIDDGWIGIALGTKEQAARTARRK
ncbi:MAG: hypothetical protein JXB10_10570 [Pirellulales bacterium]|nr:hypothetical protein [Pirellulales bacterium]